ncbi:integrase arm-type DNA-binding domain-containing protein [uncultured Jannaschia sp.]|uniref:tyrosine-type recombinase/integrase n=1 Tax=uncultured Jannaschia sp. TaxID=293347 RepID=UPI00260AEE33|nr:integrase arm-type DNA-binding domain-containing protein [uncultured Jannaschia sp.]
MKLNNTTIRAAGDGKHGDGDGLWLYRRGGSSKWVYRYTVAGKRREMGLGPFPAMSLAQARRARDAERAIVLAGGDPIAVREGQRASAIAERDRTDPTLEEAIDVIFERMRGGLRGNGERGRWMSPLRVHAIPALGARRLSTIRAHDLMAMLKPIWHAKHPTAIKVSRRLRKVLEGGKMLGWPCDPEDIDRAAFLLGEVRHREVAHAALDWQDAPAIYAALRKVGTSYADCIRWHMLTGVRSMGCRGAAIAEIEGDVWTVPPARIKGREGKVDAFRCPMVPDALAIRDRAQEFGGALLFGGRGNKPVSDVTLMLTLRTLHETATLHGMRSTLRTWAQDNEADREACEVQLGHKVYGKVEAAYARSDLLDRRHALLSAWAEFLNGGSTPTT